MEKDTDLSYFDEALEQFTSYIIDEKYSGFSSYASAYFYWCYDRVADLLEKSYYERHQELLSPYKKEQENVLWDTGINEEYDLSSLQDTDRLELGKKIGNIDDESLFDSISSKGKYKKNQEIWGFFIWKYFIRDKKLIYAIMTELGEEDEMQISEDEFFNRCNAYRQKMGMDVSRIPSGIKKRLGTLAEIHPSITISSEGIVQYPKSMEEAIIECVAISYNDSNRDYPCSALDIVAKRVQQDKYNLTEHRKRKEVEATQSRRKLISNWRDNVKYYSFDVFDKANSRLFRGDWEDLRCVESWNSLTGSLLINTMYRTLRTANEQCKFIASRMDDEVLQAMYFCIEKLMDIKRLSCLEKAKFVEKMFSLIPFFLRNADNNGNGKQQNEYIKGIFYDLAEAIRDFSVDRWWDVYIDEISETNLFRDEAIMEKARIENARWNRAFVKLYSGIQREEGG